MIYYKVTYRSAKGGYDSFEAFKEKNEADSFAAKMAKESRLIRMKEVHWDRSHGR